MYTSLSIQNFRGIRTLEMNDFRRVNILTGKNNCGKTSVLEALYFLSQSANPAVGAQFGVYRNFKNLGTDYWRSFFYNFVTNNISTALVDYVIIEGDYGKKQRSLVVKPLRYFSPTDYDGFLQERQMEEQGLVNGLSLLYMSATDGHQITMQSQITNLKDREGFEVFPKEQTEVVPPVSSILFTNPSYFTNAEKRFSRLEVNKETDSVVEALRQIEPFIKYVRFIDETFYCDIGKERLLPLNVMGDGMVRMFSIILAIATTPGGVVLIDEIDTGFHYSTLEVMWKAVYAAAKQFNVQIFATTHSYECLRALSSLLESQPENPDDTRLYRLEKEEQGHRVIRYDVEVLEAALDNYWEVR